MSPSLTLSAHLVESDHELGKSNQCSVRSFLLLVVRMLLVVRPGAPSSVLASSMPGARSSVLAPSSDGLQPSDGLHW